MEFTEKYRIIKKEPSGVNYGDTDCEHDELGVVSDYKQAVKIVSLLNENNKREGVEFYIKESRMTEYANAKDFFDINYGYGVDAKSIRDNTENFEK